MTSPSSLEDWAAYLRDTISASSGIRSSVPYVDRFFSEDAPTASGEPIQTNKQAASTQEANSVRESREINECMEWLKLIQADSSAAGAITCSSTTVDAPADPFASAYLSRPFSMHLCRTLAKDMRPPMMCEADSYHTTMAELESLMPALGALLKDSYLQLPPQHHEQLQRMLPPAEHLCGPQTVPMSDGLPVSLPTCPGALADPASSGAWEMAAAAALGGSANASAFETSPGSGPSDTSSGGERIALVSQATINHESPHGLSPTKIFGGGFGGGFAGAFSASGLRDIVLRPSESGASSSSSLEFTYSDFSHRQGELSSDSMESNSLRRSVLSRVSKLDIKDSPPSSSSQEVEPQPPTESTESPGLQTQHTSTAGTTDSAGLQTRPTGAPPEAGLQTRPTRAPPAAGLQSRSTRAPPGAGLQPRTTAALPGDGLQTWPTSALPVAGLQTRPPCFAVAADSLAREASLALDDEVAPLERAATLNPDSNSEPAFSSVFDIPSSVTAEAPYSGVEDAPGLGPPEGPSPSGTSTPSQAAHGEPPLARNFSAEHPAPALSPPLPLPPADPDNTQPTSPSSSTSPPSLSLEGVQPAGTSSLTFALPDFETGTTSPTAFAPAAGSKESSPAKTPPPSHADHSRLSNSSLGLPPMARPMSEIEKMLLTILQDPKKVYILLGFSKLFQSPWQMT
eukprot:gene4318-14430_t